MGKGQWGGVDEGDSSTSLGAPQVEGRGGPPDAPIPDSDGLWAEINVDFQGFIDVDMRTPSIAGRGAT